MLSAHDCWREGKKLRMLTLNLGFPTLDEGNDKGNTFQIQNQPVGADNQCLELGFPLSDEKHDKVQAPSVAQNN